MPSSVKRSACAARKIRKEMVDKDRGGVVTNAGMLQAQIFRADGRVRFVCAALRRSNTGSPLPYQQAAPSPASSASSRSQTGTYCCLRFPVADCIPRLLPETSISVFPVSPPVSPQVKLNGKKTHTHESYAEPMFNTLGVQADDVYTVTLASIYLEPDEWISLLEVGVACFSLFVFSVTDISTSSACSWRKIVPPPRAQGAGTSTSLFTLPC